MNPFDKHPPEHRHVAKQKELILHQEQALYEACSRDIRTFASQIKKNYIFEWFHRFIIETIQDFITSPTTHKLMILMPPRHGKSEISSCITPAFLCGLWSERVLQGGEAPYNIIIGSYSDELAKEFVSQQITYIESRVYKKIFPKIRICPRGQKYGNQFKRGDLFFDIIADISPENTFQEEGGVYKKSAAVRAFGLGGAITGRGGDIVILDDLIRDPKQAASKRQKDAMWKWYTNVLTSRIENNYGIKGKIIVLNTRWAKDDIPGRLLAKEREEWKVIQLPAFAYSEGSKYRIPEDKRREGEVLSKWRKDLSVNQRNLLSKNDFSALHQQIPVAEGGNLIKGKDIQFYDKTPEWTYKIITGDLAFKDGQENDFSVFNVWGHSLDPHKYILLEQLRGHYNYSTQRYLLKELANRHKDAYGIYIEDAANAAALYAELKREIVSFQLWPPKGQKKTDKIVRVQTVQHLFEQHKVFYPNVQIAPWVQINIEELTDFPKAEHDDTVDACTMGLIILKEITQTYASSLILSKKSPFKGMKKRVPARRPSTMI